MLSAVLSILIVVFLIHSLAAAFSVVPSARYVPRRPVSGGRRRWGPAARGTDAAAAAAGPRTAGAAAGRSCPSGGEDGKGYTGESKISR